MNMNQKVRAGYNRVAPSYSTEFRDQFKNDKHLEQLSKLLLPDSLVLDIGCGAGKPVDSFLVSRGLKVIGIDISEAQIDLARKFVPEATYQLKDMSELSKGEFRVDAVVSFYAIFHTPREKHLELLQIFKSFIKPNGYLLITMGASDWVGKEDDFCGTEMYWSHYGADKNIEFVKEAGFTILDSVIDESGGEKHLIVLAKVNGGK